MADGFNRDLEQQSGVAQHLNQKASEISNKVDELNQLLEAMKSNAVFDADSQAAIDRIKSIVDQLRPAAENAKEQADVVANQVEAARGAKKVLDSIG